MCGGTHTFFTGGGRTSACLSVSHGSLDTDRLPCAGPYRAPLRRGIDSTVRTHDEPRKNGDMSKYCSDDNSVRLLAVDQTVTDFRISSGDKKPRVNDCCGKTKNRWIGWITLSAERMTEHTVLRAILSIATTSQA